MAQNQVTSVGVGYMGAAVAAALLKDNASVTIWNRTADRPQVKSLVSSGAVFEPSITAALSRSNTILFCLLNCAAIYSVIEPAEADGSRPFAGKTVINLTTGTPRQARELEAHFKRLGAEAYFDGGIVASPELVGTPTAFVVLSGETQQQYAERLGDLLKPVGAVQYVSGDAGAASLYDVAAIGALYGMFAGAFTAIGLLKKQRGVGEADGKVKVKPPVESVVVPLVSALVPYMTLLAEQVDEERWEDSSGGPMAVHHAAIKNALQACEDEGVDASPLKFLAGSMEKAVKELGGDSGLAVVSKYFLK